MREQKCNSDQWWNNNNCLFECEKRDVCEKDYIWDGSTCSYQKRKYLAIIMDDPATTCDEIIDAEAKSSNEKPKTFLIKVNEKK